MRSLDKEKLLDLQQVRWTGMWMWLMLFAAFCLAEGLLLLAVLSGPGWLVVPLVLLVAHFMHSHLIAFHEASHRSLCPVRWLNDAVGVLLGTLNLVGYSLYRTVHPLHHAFLATERDEELWPFVDTAAPRWLRRAAAAAELTLGLIYTPVLFIRVFFRRGSPIKNRRVRRRIWVEWILMAVVWGGVITAVAWLNAWTYLLILYLLPAWLAGNLQSGRKYIEHVGLSGSTVLGSTRSIVPKGPIGHLVAITLLNEPYHGIHHEYARLPQDVLPEFTPFLSAGSPAEQQPFVTYFEAWREMLRTLQDPRVGAQWLAADPVGPNY